MLTEQDMLRISEEEKFRLQIRNELEQKNKNKAISFLNTPLGIFFLSSVLLSGMTWAYTTYTNYLTNKKESNRMYYEVSNRCFQVRKMDSICNSDDLSKIRSALFGYSNVENYALYREYSSWTLKALALELWEDESNQTKSAASEHTDILIHYYQILKNNPIADGVYQLPDKEQKEFKSFSEDIHGMSLGDSKVIWPK
ncbi:hypothetical protein C3K47_15640 [Solitalea longa]|uniref:Uncharacterized protein n=1 Tax=Solitalea longa TaxID=2079460 RepID=A0A2S4ZYS5_9SPHI|nr:hypothetical protein [Solitalea longa]POY35490.1 hypothetical protein C3K47_15640 [Solitalea longa]